MTNTPRGEAVMIGALSLASAPTFVIMAVVTGLLGGDPAMMMCPAGASPLSGMTAMYVLMSVFHLAPWLKLVARRNQQGAGT